MINLKETINDFVHFNLVDTLIVVAVCVFIYLFITKVIFKNVKKADVQKKITPKGLTYIKVISKVLKYVFFILALLIILEINGIDVSSMLAGVGIAGAIIGLALQDTLKDIIRGFSILYDDYYKMGDVIKFGEVTGEVTEISLNSTKVRDIKSGNLVSIANRKMLTAEVVSPFVYVKVPLPYELSQDMAKSLMLEIKDEILQTAEVKTARYLGISAIDDSDIKHMIEVTCDPLKRLAVNRECLEIIMRKLEKENISVPYPQMEIRSISN